MNAPQKWHTYGFGLLSKGKAPTHILAEPETVSLVDRVQNEPPNVTFFMLTTKTEERAEYFISKSSADFDVKSQSGKYWLRAKKITYPGLPNAAYIGHVSDLSDKTRRDVFVAFTDKRELPAEPVLEQDYNLQILPLNPGGALKKSKLKISGGSIYYDSDSYGKFKSDPHGKGHKHHIGSETKMIEGWFIPAGPFDPNNYVVGFRHFHPHFVPNPGDPECTDPHVGVIPPPPPPPYGE